MNFLILYGQIRIFLCIKTKGMMRKRVASTHFGCALARGLRCDACLLRCFVCCKEGFKVALRCSNLESSRQAKVLLLRLLLSGGLRFGLQLGQGDTDATSGTMIHENCFANSLAK